MLAQVILSMIGYHEVVGECDCIGLVNVIECKGGECWWSFDIGCPI